MLYKLLKEDPRPECDVVMKGGITSGVVYPRAAVALAGKYRFRRVGGSSAGAIAAVLTAAAEYRRSGGVSPGEALPEGPEARSGWDRLDQLPEFLEKHLIDLFDPSKGTRSVFDFVVAWLEPTWTMGKKIRTAIGRLVLGAPVIFAFTLLVSLIPAFATATALVGGLDDGRWLVVLRSLLVWLPVALVVALIAAGIRLARGAVRVINGNGFGLVNGHRPSPVPGPASPQKGAALTGGDAPGPLTDWLTREVNVTAGRAADGTPLTFGDLWGADATQWFLHSMTNELPDDDETTRKTRRFDGERPSIIWSEEVWPEGAQPGFDPILDLRVMTTCLSHRLPRTFPFLDETYFYCPDCLSQYFPESVMEQVGNYSRDANNTGNELDLNCPTHRETEIRRLPFAPYLPIVMAARLSLSFPVLISAVPFYCIDRNEITGQKEIVTAWFSDGGITSNFPMQFFDSWVPERPTFGINLEDYNERYDAPGEFVGLRKPTGSASPRITPITGVAGFLKTMGNTMHDWPDQLQMDAPGFRDRIVTVRTEKGQGGLNLKMSSDQIQSLAGRGADAGAKVVKEFLFEPHLWLRFRITMNGFSLALARLRKTFPTFERHVPAPWEGTKKFLKPEVEHQVREDAKELIKTADEWASREWPATTAVPPRPEPELRFGTGTK